MTMYFKKTTVSTAIVAALLSTSAIAQASNSSIYLGASYADLEYDNGEAKFSTPAVILNVGYQFNPNIAVEARVGTGVKEDSKSVMDGSNTVVREFELDHYYGLFGRFGVPMGDTAYTYLQLGYGKVSMLGETTSFDQDLGYGVGLDINFSQSFTGNLEYMNYHDDADKKIDGIAVGLQYRF